MDYRTYELSRKEKAKAVMLSTLVFMAEGYLFFDTFLLGAAGIILYPQIKKSASSYMADKRRQRLEKEFKDCLYSFSTSFSSGRHMKEAMKEAEMRLTEVYGKDSLMALELDRMVTLAESVRERDVDLWTDFANRSGMEDIENFALVYRSIYESGGNLTDVVSKAAGIITEKINVEGEIKSISSERKLEGRIIALMPVVILLFLKTTSPEYMEVLYTSVPGRIIMTAGFCLIIAGIWLIERITSIEI